MKSKSLFFIPFLLFFFLLETVQLQAQNDSIKTKHYKHALGIAAGFTTGYGLSYQFTPNKFGIQACFAPYKDDYGDQYSIGITFLYKLVETEFANLFAYQGNHFFYSSNKTYGYIYSYPYYNYSEIETVNKYWNNGIGLDIELILQKRISLNLMGGYAVYKNFKNIGFTGETSLYFKF